MMNSTPETKTTRHPDHRLAAGVILILFGLAALLQRWLDVGAYATLLIGFAMLVWGSASRSTGWIIPGGVLTGIGAGILVTEGPWQFSGEAESGVFLLCFAAGWFLITALTALFTNTQWWALIPGGIMAVIGGSILISESGLRWLDLNLVYAALLILVGLALVVFSSRRRKQG